jgi:hypothetical protein
MRANKKEQKLATSSFQYAEQTVLREDTTNQELGNIIRGQVRPSG